ncbi:MAG: hypothetical protein DI536_07460 [Archangium gephyra]|uniref:Uncharacterized protein n=1 Tax=Archangium gephyra TaxID=48 RepID=A0A2W5TKK7_9BACT|nr:MAG: hypothetical protein DI536_07460 [Archangium gephyra]
MPPDVLLVLASSGISFIASLMFFVSDERAPLEKKSPELSFCLPPARAVKTPPPLPAMPECAVSLTITSTMTLKPVGDEWVVTLESTPMADVPALQVKDGKEIGGSVHDLRWHGSAGIAKRTRTSWKQKPGRA